MKPATSVRKTPRSLTCEVARLRFSDRLEKRWDVPVTTVAAGAGFGKTTALAQAVRADVGRPDRRDVWLPIELRDRDTTQFATDIVAAIDGSGRPRPIGADPVASVTSAIERCSPSRICIVFDDLHLLGEGGDSVRLVAELVRRLPDNGHLVLAGRSLPTTLPLARLRAREMVIALGEPELSFDRAEVVALATRLDKPIATVDPTCGGWPALVYLSMVAGSSAPWEFLQQEVLTDLADTEREVMTCLAPFVSATPAEVAGAIGRDVDLEALAERVPMISRHGDDYHCHDLWRRAVQHHHCDGHLTELRKRVAAVLMESDRVVDAGTSALVYNDWSLLGQAGSELVNRTLSATPLDIIEPWLAAIPAEHRGEPEILLMTAAAAYGRSFRDERIDGWLDRARTSFVDRRETVSAVASVALATVAAHARADTIRLVELAELAGRMEGADRHPIVRVLLGGVASVLAEMEGRPEEAAEHLSRTPLDDVPPALALSIHRFWVHCLLMSGRADEAVELADQHLHERGNAHSRRTPGFARWCAGDPVDLGPLLESPHLDSSIGARDTFLEQAIGLMVRTSSGREIGDLPDPLACDNERDAAVLTGAVAAGLVARGRESDAVRTVADYLARYPVADHALGERHLRRHLAPVYVLSPELRSRWDRAELGPAHDRIRTVARALLRSRTGRPAMPDVETGRILTSLPLVWSAELLCRAHAVEPDRARTVAAELAAIVGRPLLLQLRCLAGGSDAPVAEGATALLSAVPIPPSEPTVIGVLGRLTVHTGPGGDDAARGDRQPAELRRSRVRQLVEVLTVRRSLSRDQILGLLWPDYDQASARRNLRVTLTYLRRLLEPDRLAGEAGYVLDVDAERVTLVESPALVVDLWGFERDRQAASAARGLGDVAIAIDRYESAVGRWRGRPLQDLVDIADGESTIRRLVESYIEAELALGQLHLLDNEPASASASARRATALEPHDERIRYMALTAALAIGDHGVVADARAELDRTLAELGVVAPVGR